MRLTANMRLYAINNEKYGTVYTKVQKQYTFKYNNTHVNACMHVCHC